MHVHHKPATSTQTFTHTHTYIPSYSYTHILTFYILLHTFVCMCLCLHTYMHVESRGLLTDIYENSQNLWNQKILQEKLTQEQLYSVSPHSEAFSELKKPLGWEMKCLSTTKSSFPSFNFSWIHEYDLRLAAQEFDFELSPGLLCEPCAC